MDEFENPEPTTTSGIPSPSASPADTRRVFRFEWEVLIASLTPSPFTSPTATLSFDWFDFVFVLMIASVTPSPFMSPTATLSFDWFDFVFVLIMPSVAPSPFRSPVATLSFD